MVAKNFNDGWVFNPKVSPYAKLQGQDETRVPVRLPHDATISAVRRPDAPDGGRVGYFPGGVFEYSKTFMVSEDYRDKVVFLKFDGVHRDAMVYVNEAYAGQRPFGYSPFAIELTPFIKYGEDNTIRVDARSHADSRWYTGTGILRDVHLLLCDPVHFALEAPTVRTQSVNSRTAVLEVVNRIVNSTRNTVTVRVRSELRSNQSEVVAYAETPVTVLPGQEATERHRLVVDQPQLWGPDSPYLYDLASTISSHSKVIEAKRQDVGIRTVAVDPNRGLLINGEVTKLRGACIHHDNGILGGVAIPRAEERRVEKLLDAGFNAIRSSHNPISKTMLEACDRLGMLVVDETFDVWTQGKTDFDYSLAFPTWWQQDVTAMVAKGMNHPSLIMYSIGNEIIEIGTPHGAVWSRKIVELIRNLDQDRPITNGINGFVAVMDKLSKLGDSRPSAKESSAKSGDGGINAAMNSAGDFMNMVSGSQLVSEVTEESFAMLDVAGMNYGDARYTIDQQLFPDRVILGTETFPPRIYDNWKLVTKYPNVIGDFTWTGWDYLGEVGIGRIQWADEPAAFEAPFPWMTAHVGDIDISGNRRPISYYREAVFGLAQEPYIAVKRPHNYGRQARPGQWSWSDTISSWTWDVPLGTLTGVEIYSDAEEVELFVNGVSQGRKPAGDTARYITEFEVAYEPGELEVIAFTGGVEGARSSLRTASVEVTLQMLPDRHIIKNDVGDLCFVEILAADVSGAVNTLIDTQIEVTVSGAGELLAVGNASSTQTGDFHSGLVRLFEGRALAVVRPTGTGDVTVRATSAGIAGSVTRFSVE